MKKIISLFAFCMLATATFAQQNSDDFMRSTGKIYVVVAVIVLSLVGIFLYLANLDKKLTHIENQIKSNKIK